MGPTYAASDELIFYGLNVFIGSQSKQGLILATFTPNTLNLIGQMHHTSHSNDSLCSFTIYK